MRSGIRKWARLLGLLAFAVMTLTACATGEELEKEYTAKAKAGDVEAQYQLGLMYFEGNGVDQSEKKGEFWIRKAAEQGHPRAQNDIGTMYANGVVVRKNMVEAIKWLTLSAKQGFGPGIRYMKDLEETLPREQIEKAKALAEAWKPTPPASSKGV